MDIVTDEETFLRDLVKGSRQRIHQVKWIDRDGTQRLTALSQADFTRLHTIAQRQRRAPAEVLRQAAHIPVAKPAAKVKETTKADSAMQSSS
ncbi:MAG: hypothetical protein WC378_05530 [Opitutaceae bacterium]|jgi:hypothetical protein